MPDPENPKTIDEALKELDTVFDNTEIDEDTVRDALTPDLSEGTVTLQKLNDLIKSITDDNELKTFEELSYFNHARIARNRLRQRVSGEPAIEELAAAYMSSYELTFPKQILFQLKRLRLYVKKRAQYQKEYGKEIDVRVSDTYQKAAVEHITALTNLLKARLAIGQLRALALIEKDFGRKPSREDLKEAISNIPEKIRGAYPRETMTGQLEHPEFSFDAKQKLKYETMTADQLLRDPLLTQTAEQLRLDLNWFLTYEEGVPGVLKSRHGDSPIDLLFADQLSRAWDANLAMVRSFRGPGKKMEKGRQQFMDLRPDLTNDTRDFRLAMGRERIDFLHDFNVHEVFGRAFGKTADGKRGTPAPLDVKAAREHMDREVSASIGAMQEHFDKVINREQKTVLLGMTEEDLEDFWKNKGRHKIAMPLLEAMYSYRIGTENFLRKGVSKIPLVPDALVLGDPVSEQKKKALGSLRRKLGFPEKVIVGGKEVDFNIFDKKHWDALKLDDAQWKKIEQAMLSTKDVLQKYTEERDAAIERLNNDQVVLQTLRGRRHPDDLIGTYPDTELLGAIERGEFMITPANLGENSDSDAKICAIYLALESQMMRHWDLYTEVNYHLDGELRDISNFAHELGGEIDDARPPFPWMMTGLITLTAGLTTWYTYNLVMRSKGSYLAPPRYLRAGFLMAHDTARAGRAGYSIARSGVSLAARTGMRVYHNGVWHTVDRYGWMRVMNNRELKVLKFSIDEATRYSVSQRLLSRTELMQCEKDLIKAVHDFGDINPATGRWPRDVLREKFRMLTEGVEGITFIDEATEAPMLFRFTEEEARILLRNGMCGADTVGDVAEAMVKSGNAAAADDFLRAAAQSERIAPRAVRGLRWGAVIPITAVLAEGWILRQNVFELADAIEYEDRVRQSVHTSLTHPSVGFAYDPIKDVYTRVDSNTGKRVEIRVNESILEKLPEKEDIAMDKLVADSVLAAEGLALLCMKSGVAIPLGVLVASGAVTVNVAYEAKNRNQAYDFVEQSEPYMLAYLGTGVTGFDEFQIQLQGIEHIFARNPSMETRSKMMFAAFMFMLKSDQKMLMSITGGDLSPSSLNTFYETDFKQFVLPTFSAALFTVQEHSAKSREKQWGQAPWKETKNLQLQSTFAGAPNAKPGNFVEAYNFAVQMYEARILETRWVHLRRTFDQLVANGYAEEAKYVEQQLSQLGKKRVLGTSLFYADTEIMANDARRREKAKDGEDVPIVTRADVLMEGVIAKLDRNEDITMEQITLVEEKGKSHPLSIPKDELDWEGEDTLPDRFDLRDYTANPNDIDELCVFGHDYKLHTDSASRDVYAAKGATGDAINLVRPDFFLGKERQFQEGLAPYQRMQIAGEVEDALVELNYEGPDPVFGVQVGPDRVLVKPGITSFAYKIVDLKRNELVRWSSIDQRKFARLVARGSPAVSWRSQEERMGYLAALSAMRLPNQFNDEDSITRAVSLFLSSAYYSSTVEYLTWMLGSILPTDQEYRGRFIEDLMTECARIGTVQERSEIVYIITKLKGKALKGRYGKEARERMPKIDRKLSR